MSDDIEFEDFSVPPEGENEPRAIYERLVAEFKEFAHIKDGEPRVEFLMRHQPKVKQGREVLGTCHMPSVQGELRPIFDWMMGRLFGAAPDFLIVLARDYWLASDDRMREILVYHETLHIGHAVDKWGEPRFDKETGRPVFCIRGHDVEEFRETVRRYGAYSDEIRLFIEAAGGSLTGSDTL